VDVEVEVVAELVSASLMEELLLLVEDMVSLNVKKIEQVCVI
jgi:hypothetical protein